MKVLKENPISVAEVVRARSIVKRLIKPTQHNLPNKTENDLYGNAVYNATIKARKMIVTGK